ncbi:hypothetical protein A2X44_04145 [candidate division CPR3 bacterium GWF2_35_18]|uniref:CheW-like domain-containing protein n=1 Tax=candidate division CPR3 bacterium GW2011_GWF2_35_18 TaxID=1618350 RepID=A0A0G0BIQ8_UNCC3|nr:MAG: hypothetical protein UR67_C0007G0018 [candidate division CPR3 bacterium GW2011_GWF2_35_18]OGB62546.1 MAG: hypothetical protein A2X44_04145 [candidate division CPR3 bacterium GWF2_35_18]OGB65797.1 MAG: hypothetical protein A2250_01395 [candidate division CPR3 bacterium RIFOXYA2_FULL_35_13]OGB77370.1 MAG: hypothetical protein A2476_03835 [candidate division CPR3 bacterium RIFOXYC2_FULL_35_7]OGB79285.1 MAG: hypothetical protein A2296_03915 [candidate division CPR3 bacterium RIFOXYB2_FULL_3
MVKTSLKEASVDGKDLKIVTFALSKELYGINIPQVKEITSCNEYTTIPNTPSYILGLLDLRGEVIVLLDLQKRFNLKPRENEGKKHVIICQFEDHKLGILVDNVEGIISVSEDEIKDPEEIIKKKISPEFLSGVIVYDEKVLIVLNIANLFEKEDISKLESNK